MERVTSICKIWGQKEDSQDLMLQVRDKGLCRQCEGCISFCIAMDYQGIGFQAEGLPSYQNGSGCSLECGLCYMICPVTGDLNNEVREMVSWVPPHGRILGAFAENERKEQGQNQKIPDPLTGVLLHLFDSGQIDGALFTTKATNGRNEAWLGMSIKDVMIMREIAEENFSGVTKFSLPSYSKALVHARQRGLKRLAFVGMPCEIEATRNMQVLGIIPADIIKFRFGMFCLTDPLQNQKQNNSHGTEQVLSACDLCPEFSSELADIAFGGVPGDFGNIALIRTSLGWKALIGAARKGMMDVARISDNSLPMQGVHKLAVRKKNSAVTFVAHNHSETRKYSA